MENASRPRSIRETVHIHRSRPQPIDPLLREFLDEFYAETDASVRYAMISDEPVLTGRATIDAYVAAVVEHLALRYDLQIPEWTLKPERFLKTAFFPGGLESMKATWLMESPTAFRRRMIFVDLDPLYRPRRKEPLITVERFEEPAPGRS